MDIPMRIAHYLAGFFRAVSYISTIFLWLWLFMLVMPALLESDAIRLLTPEPAVVDEATMQGGPSSPLLLFIGGVVTVFMVIVTIVILIRLPRTLTKTGEKITHDATERIMPILTHHKKIPKKNRMILTKRTIVYVRVCFVIAPLVATFFAPSIDKVDIALGAMVGLILALTALVSLLIEHILVATTTHQKA